MPETKFKSDRLEHETIITTAARYGHEYAEQILCDEPNCGTFAQHDSIPDGDYVELMRAYPNATYAEISAAERAYKSAFNAAVTK